MKNAKTILMLSAVVMFVTAPVMAVPVEVYSVDTKQDPLFVEGLVHELGDFFPPEEEIVSMEVPWGGHIPCPADYTGGPCVQVEMTNLTNTDWTEVYYVADMFTSLTNDDGLIGNMVMSDATLAFKIDWIGVNTPLVFESMAPDNIFQAGETWEFVIQEYANAFGGPPAPFDSIGISSVSVLFPPSTGSIIAIPEPATMSLLILGGIGVLLRRRRK
jgi:hypothetical protein